jgi:uncharacterized membrane protein YuzA (DUF378 family)
MKRWSLLLGSILLSYSVRAESLAGYFLRFVRNEAIFQSMINLTYVFTGILSLFNLVLAFQKFNEGDGEAGRTARNWCLSLLLIAVTTFFVSTLMEDSKTMAQINVGTALQQTSSGIKGSFGVISKLVYVVCGIIGLMVLPGKFQALQQGDRYAGKSVTAWGLSLFGIVAMTYTLHQIFFL